MTRARFSRPILLLTGIACAAGSAWGQTPAEETQGKFFDLTAGLGINAHFAHTVANYINLIAQPRLDQRVDIIVSAPEFFASSDLQFSDEWSAGVEYSLFVKSYSIEDRSGYARSEFSYQVHMPTILVHWLMFGEGYRVKVGGGVGYHFCSFRQQFQPYGNDETLKSAGPSFKLEVVGNTKFDETFYGSIGLDLRWDSLGTLGRREPGLSVDRAGELPAMSFFNAGIKFGVTFQLN